MSTMGRPRKEFDWDLVDSLCMLDATQEFIAERLIHQDGEELNSDSIKSKVNMIRSRIKEKFDTTFLEYRAQKIQSQIIKLRQVMWKGAFAGNITMQIWLSKNYANMSDKQEIKQQTNMVLDADKFQFVEPKE